MTVTSAARKQVDGTDLGCANPSPPKKRSEGSKDLKLKKVWTLRQSLSPITLPNAPAVYFLQVPFLMRSPCLCLPKSHHDGLMLVYLKIV